MSEDASMDRLGAAGPDAELVGWTCESCGDTFTTDTGERPKCPSCGGSAVRMAAEPFL